MISHLWKTAAVLISRTKWNNAFIFPLNKWKHDSSGNTIKQNPCPYIKLQVIEEITFSSAFDLKISQFLMPQIKKKTNVQRNIGLIESIGHSFQYRKWRTITHQQHCMQLIFVVETFPGEQKSSTTVQFFNYRGWNAAQDGYVFSADRLFTFMGLRKFYLLDMLHKQTRENGRWYYLRLRLGTISGLPFLIIATNSS